MRAVENESEIAKVLEPLLLQVVFQFSAFVETLAYRSKCDGVHSANDRL